MIEHPEHTGASVNPSAPWNQGDEDELVCRLCGELPDDPAAADLDGPCQNTQPEYDRAGNEIPPCTGTYASLRCDLCGHYNCRCSND